MGIFGVFLIFGLPVVFVARLKVELRIEAY
jgi:hypothetical protein